MRSFDPSLPRLGAGKLRDALSAAQSSIQSLLDAQEQREQLAAIEELRDRIWALMRPRKAQGGGYGLDEVARMPRKWRRHGTEATKRLRGRAGGRGDVL